MEKNLLTVSFNEDDGKYYVSLCEGTSIPETAFAIAVIIKCLMRDGYLEKYQDMLDLITKYLTDVQYNEIEEEEDVKEIE